MEPAYELNEIHPPGLDPRQPIDAHPGSDHKVSILAARYAAGLPLWHEEDCRTRNPGEDGEPF